jgi:hypothetical protein
MINLKDRNYKFPPPPNLGTLNSFQNDSKQIQQHSQVHIAKSSVIKNNQQRVIGLGVCKDQFFQLDCIEKIPKLNITRVESIVVVNL